MTFRRCVPLKWYQAWKKILNCFRDLVLHRKHWSTTHLFWLWTKVTFPVHFFSLNSSQHWLNFFVIVEVLQRKLDHLQTIHLENINDFVPLLRMKEDQFLIFCKQSSQDKINRIYHFSEKLKVFQSKNLMLNPFLYIDSHAPWFFLDQTKNSRKVLFPERTNLHLYNGNARPKSANASRL